MRTDQIPRSPFTTPVETNVVELVTDRLEAWRLNLDSLIAYFHEVEGLERNSVNGLTKAAALLSASVPNPSKLPHPGLLNPVSSNSVQSVSSTSSPAGSYAESPTTDSLNKSNVWLAPLQSFALKAASAADSINKYVKEETLCRLEALREEFLKRSKELRSRLAGLQQRLAKEHDGLNEAMREHEKLWTAHLHSTAQHVPSLPSASPPAGTQIEHKDAWLSELSLHRCIATFLAEKTKYCDGLLSLFSDSKLLEYESGERLQTILSEFFIVKSKQTLLQNEQLRETATGLRAVDPSFEWGLAVSRCKLDYEWYLQAPPLDGFTYSVLNQISCNISEALSGRTHPGSSSSGMVSPSIPASTAPVRPIKVVKAGYLLRPATFGRSYNVHFFVLTDSHFMHGYVPTTRRRLSLTSADTHLSDSVTSEGTAYRIPNATQRVQPKALAELNSAITTAWLGPTQFASIRSPVDPASISSVVISVDPRLLVPSLTIPLHSLPSVTVAVESPKDCTFAITVPGTPGFFGRGDKKYTLKSFVEEDMVDWVIAIKDQVGQFSISGSEPRRSVEPVAPPDYRYQEREQQVKRESPFGITLSGHSITPPSHEDEGGEAMEPFGHDDSSAEQLEESRRKDSMTADKAGSGGGAPISLDNPWEK